MSVGSNVPLSGFQPIKRHISKEKAKWAFRNLFNRMRVSTSADEVKVLVDEGQRQVDNSHGQARKYAEKNQEKLAKHGQKKEREIRQIEKSRSIGVKTPFGGANYSDYERSDNPEPAPTPGNANPLDKRRRVRTS